MAKFAQNTLVLEPMTAGLSLTFLGQTTDIPIGCHAVQVSSTATVAVAGGFVQHFFC